MFTPKLPLLLAVALTSLVNVSAARANVHCDVDENGDYCMVDLITECTDRTACSVPFMGNHAVYVISKQGRAVAHHDRGQVGTELQNETLQPGNPEVCVDDGLNITKVYYQPQDQGHDKNGRWSSHSGGMIGGYTDKLTDDQAEKIPTYYPVSNEGQKLKSKCVQFAVNDPKEALYTIQSVRVAVDLDRNRVKTMKDIMTKASYRLSEDLPQIKKVAQDAAKVLRSDAALVNAINLFIAAVDDASKDMDRLKFIWTWKEARTPITSPKIMQAMATAYVQGKFVLSQLSRLSGGSIYFEMKMKDFVAEINQGFGFNTWDPSEAQGEIPKESARTGNLGEVRSQLKTVSEQSALASTWSNQYGEAIGEFSRKVAALQKDFDSMPVDPTKADHFMISPDVFLRALDAYKSCVALTDPADKNSLPRTKRNGSPAPTAAYVKVLEPFCAALASGFRINPSDQTSATASQLVSMGLSALDSQRKFAPVLDVLAMGLTDATGAGSGLSPDDATFKSAGTMLTTVTKGILPTARTHGDMAVTQSMSSLGQQWQSPEFQSFLQEVLALSNGGDSSAATARDVRTFLTGATKGIIAANPELASLFTLPNGFELN